MSRKLLCVKKNQAQLGYYSLVCAAICFGPRSKSILWSKTVSRDFSWGRSLFLFIAQAHRKRFSATKDFAVLLKQQREKGWDGKMKATGTGKWLAYGFVMASLVSHGSSESEYQNIHLSTGSFWTFSGYEIVFLGQGIVSYSASAVRNQERHHIRMMATAPLCRRDLPFVAGAMYHLG